MAEANASAEPAAAPQLLAEGLALVRGGLLLCKGLSFAVAPGGALVVRGANGAGKSSLLRALAGLLAPAAGRIVNPFPTALVAEGPALKPTMPVGAELAFWARLDGASPESVARAAAAMAIAPLLDLPCAMLSSGQRQRVAIARTIAGGARLWLLDEPTNALDDHGVALLMAAIAAHRGGGGLVVVATHLPLPLDGADVLRL